MIRFEEDCWGHKLHFDEAGRKSLINVLERSENTRSPADPELIQLLYALKGVSDE